MSTDAKEEPPKSGTYEAGCHCGYISFDVTLSPPLEEQRVLECNCSICRRMGYLLVYPKKEQVVWRDGARERYAVYRFNTKTKDQMFCPKCGASLGIDFRNEDDYGISVRTFNNVDLSTLTYRKLDGVNKVGPAADLSGVEHKDGAKDAHVPSA